MRFMIVCLIWARISAVQIESRFSFKIGITSYVEKERERERERERRIIGHRACTQSTVYYQESVVCTYYHDHFDQLVKLICVHIFNSLKVKV